MIERRIKAAKFPAPKSLDAFDVDAIPSLNKRLVLDLARCELVERRENVMPNSKAFRIVANPDKQAVQYQMPRSVDPIA